MARDHRLNDRLSFKLIEQPDCPEYDISDDGYYKNVAYHRREFFRRPGIFYIFTQTANAKQLRSIQSSILIDFPFMVMSFILFCEILAIGMHDEGG